MGEQDNVRRNSLGLDNGGMGYVDTTDQWSIVPPEVREHLTRIARHYPAPHTPKPEYGELYDSLRTKYAWDSTSDFFGEATITPSTTAPVIVPLTVSNAPLIRLSQYPGAVACYFFVAFFTFAIQGGAMTGALDFRYIDPNGNVMPLGMYPAGSPYAGQLRVQRLSTSPITDPTSTNYGQIYCGPQTLAGTISNVVTQLAFSVVYLQPSTTAVAPEHYVKPYGDES